MDKLAIVEILAKYNPNLSAYAALEIANEIAELNSTSNVVAFPGSDPDLIEKAEAWARKNLDEDSILNYKIKSIKCIREAWPVGLKEAKEIVERIQVDIVDSAWMEFDETDD